MGRWAQSIRRGGISHGATQQSGPWPDPAQMTLAPIAGTDMLWTDGEDVPALAPPGTTGARLETGIVSNTYTSAAEIDMLPGSQVYTPTYSNAPGTIVFCRAQWVDSMGTPLSVFGPEFTLTVL